MARRKNSGRIRIIGGRWRGRRIDVPDVPGLRPTPDRVRETLFNWLAPYMEGARVLDLFAGSGILGLEALSRGALSLMAVERDHGIASRLRESGGKLDASGLRVVESDAEAFLGKTAAGPFDLVFVDPPHADTDYDGLCGRLDASGILESGGFIYLEHSRRRISGFTPPISWHLHRSGRAGDIVYQLWRGSSSVPD